MGKSFKFGQRKRTNQKKLMRLRHQIKSCSKSNNDVYEQQLENDDLVPDEVTESGETIDFNSSRNENITDSNEVFFLDNNISRGYSDPRLIDCAESVVAQDSEDETFGNSIETLTFEENKEGGNDIGGRSNYHSGGDENVVNSNEVLKSDGDIMDINEVMESSSGSGMCSNEVITGYMKTDSTDGVEIVEGAEIVEIDASSDVDASDIPDENVDVYGTNGEEIKVEGRRIVEYDFFMEQLRRILVHNNENCSFDNLSLQKEVRNGFHSKFFYHCRGCDANFRVHTSKDEKTTDTISLNSSAVLGANLIGIGYTQLEQFASVVDIPTMCSDNFKKRNDKIGEFWEQTAEATMRQAAKEEAQAAIARGDVDPVDGIPYITVVVDAAWSKRSYNKNFTALSGVGAIVGAYTGKVLWIGVRNKYCVTCVRSENKKVTTPVHVCTKNYTGPSSEMEWHAILEGFKSSVELYNLRYMKIIADGDSSTYSKLLEHKPYQDRHIVKIECTNHLLRNLRKKIEASVKGIQKGLRKHVNSNLERVRKDICCAVIYRKKENSNENEKISSLKSDLDNVIHHVFGDHGNCPAYIKTFCKNDEENYIPALQQCGVYDNIYKAIRELMYCAKDLILGETNNPAEHYNSIVAKFVGGKRINFSLSNAYSYKANAAAVQFNTKAPLTAFYNTKFNTNPSALGRKIEMKRLQKSEREKERRKQMKINKVFPIRFCRKKQSGEGGYGEQCQKPDLSPEDYENEKKILTQKIKKYQEDRVSVEMNTREKRQSTLWHQAGANIILSNSFGVVCKARVFAGHVKDILHEKFAETKAMKHNSESQPIALKQLNQEQDLSIRCCGLFIDTEHMGLGASPSGIIDDSDIVVEIQCPITIMNRDPNEPKVLEKLDYMEVANNQIIGLKKNHAMYYDIQGQLHICNKKTCVFAIWTSTRYRLYVEHVERDDDFFNTKMKTQLLTFYEDWLMPELIDSRIGRNMPIREPNK